MNIQKCPLCKNDTDTIPETVGNFPAIRYVCETCGPYIGDITFNTAFKDDPTYDENKIRISGAIRWYNDFYSNHEIITLGLEDAIKIIKEGVDWMKVPDDNDIVGKKNLLLQYIAKKVKRPSVPITLNSKKDFSICFAKDYREFSEYLYALHKEEYLVVGKGDGEKYGAKVTLEGFEHLNSITALNIDSVVCFVAMNFDDTYVDLYKNCIKKGILDAGYRPLRVDEEDEEFPDSDQKIDNRITDGIERSKFIVADYTGGKTAVYWEAGYAKGLGIKVINCCMDDEEEKEKLSFDTDKYPHNYWKWDEFPDFQERLTKRIIKEFGKGNYIESK